MAGGCEGKRQTVADEILMQLETLAKRIYFIRDSVLTKLEPVMVSSQTQCEAGCGIEEEKALREYPPYFARLRDVMLDANRTLDGINDAIKRTEL